jgi:phosphocarrier protein HPr
MPAVGFRGNRVVRSEKMGCRQ